MRASPAAGLACDRHMYIKGHTKNKDTFLSHHIASYSSRVARSGRASTACSQQQPRVALARRASSVSNRGQFLSRVFLSTRARDKLGVVRA